MLSGEQIIEIREHLERSQNPVFFFDNDIDGLMSFIILRRYIGRGKGVAIKSFPELDANYSHKVDEFNADYVFILDKPVVSQGFIDEVYRKNIPIIWIDHHDVGNNVARSGEKNISYYNPVFSKDKSNEPISYISYKISGRKEDMWLAIAGCLGDNFMPEFLEDFVKEYPGLWKKDIQSAFQALYESDFGKIIQILAFALKDRTSNVVYMINFLISVKSPNDILFENEKNFKIISRYKQINKTYLKLLEKAKKIARSSRKVIFFQYSGDLSISADLANELSYRFPGKIIIVAYVKGGTANLSVRGRIDVRKITLDAIKNIEGATGGGHEHATGCKIPAGQLLKFKEFFDNAV
ncbi:MAG: DHHA1 domain-containing protein [Candidatus Pacearchaeota archaeon]